MKKILVIDDQYFVTLSLKRLLSHYDYEVITASNGYEGIIQAKKKKPDLIILDLNMPIMDGKTTIKKIKDDEELKDIPIIVLTAFSDLNIIINLNKLGINSYIKKPFEQQDLLKRIDLILNKKGDIKSKENKKKDEKERRKASEINKKIYKDIPTYVHGTIKMGEATVGKRMLVRDLRPGMIICEEVKLNNEMPFLPKGAILTEKLIEKLKELGVNEVLIKIYDINKEEGNK